MSLDAAAQAPCLRSLTMIQLRHRTHPQRSDLSTHRQHQHQPHNQRDQSRRHRTLHPFLRSRFGQSWIHLPTLIRHGQLGPRKCCCSSPRVSERLGERVAEMLSIQVLTEARIPAAIRVALLGSLVCSATAHDHEDHAPAWTLLQTLDRLPFRRSQRAAGQDTWPRMFCR